MLLRCLKAELQKCRRSPVWLAFVLLPVFPAILGTVNYLGNIEVLDNAWYSLWSQHTLFSSMFFLPALLGVFCAGQWRLEHADHNWNSLMTAPVPVRNIFWSKFLVIAGLSFVTQVLFFALYLAAGFYFGFQSPVPPDVIRWFLCAWIGSLPVAAMQLFFAMRIRSFAV